MISAFLPLTVHSHVLWAVLPATHCIPLPALFECQPPYHTAGAECSRNPLQLYRKAHICVTEAHASGRQTFQVHVAHPPQSAALSFPRFITTRTRTSRKTRSGRTPRTEGSALPHALRPSISSSRSTRQSTGMHHTHVSCRRERKGMYFTL